jgi:hypothetical protein
LNVFGSWSNGICSLNWSILVLVSRMGRVGPQQWLNVTYNP